MTTPTYTLSDLEALRERCAKVADRLAQNIADESHRSASVEAIARAREGAVCAVAERIRALPLTPQTEEVWRCPNTNRGLHHCGASAHPKHGGGHFYSCTLIDCPLMARATTQTEEGKK